MPPRRRPLQRRASPLSRARVALPSHTSPSGLANHRRWPCVLLATSALIFSTGGLFIRKLDHPHAWQTVFWRSLSACVSLALVIIWRERTNPLRAIVKIGRPGWARRGGILRVVDRDGRGADQDKCRRRAGDLRAQPAGGSRAGMDPDRRASARLHVGRDRGHSVPAWHSWSPARARGGSASGALIALVIPLAFGYGTVMIRRHSEIAMAPAMLLSAMIERGDRPAVRRPVRHQPATTSLLLLTFGFAQLGIGLALVQHRCRPSTGHRCRPDLDARTDHGPDLGVDLRRRVPGRARADRRSDRVRRARRAHGVRGVEGRHVDELHDEVTRLPVQRSTRRLTSAVVDRD